MPETRPPEEEVILQVGLGDLLLSDGMIGYYDGEQLFLPLGELSAALEFPIEVDAAAGTAQGWFVAEENSFRLSIPAGTVEIAGDGGAFKPGLVEAQALDIFVAESLVEAWFSLSIEFSLSDLAVFISSERPLPIELRLARAAAWERLNRGGPTERAELPRIEVPYAVLDWPFVDVNFGAGISISRTEPTTRSGSYNLLAAGDIAFLNGELYVTGDNIEPLSDARLILGRKDPEGDLFGLGLSEFVMGDVFSVDIPLVSGSALGRGAVISTYPLTRSNEFDQVTLRGNVPPGYDAELYRNGVLLDVQTIGENGFYEFLDVPLIFGVNVFRVVAYGPQGQVREFIEQYIVGDGLVRPGEWNFRLSAIQQDEPLIPVAVREEEDPLRGQERLSFETELGLTREISLAASAGSIPLEDGRHDYVQAGVRASFLSSLWRLDAAQDLAGGNAVEASLLTSLLDVNLFAEHTEFRDFHSEDHEDGEDPLIRRSEVRLDGALPLYVLPDMPFSLRAAREEYESGDTAIAVGARLSTRIGDVALSNFVDAQLDSQAGVETRDVSGALLASGGLWDLRLRGGLDYDVAPITQVSGLTLDADLPLDDGLFVSAGVTHSFLATGGTSARAAVSWDIGPALLGVTGSATDSGDYAAGLALSFSLARDPLDGGIRMTSSRIAKSGAAATLVYLDADADGQRDETDPPIEGASFVSAGSRGDWSTGEDGTALLIGLSTDAPTDLQLDQSTLEDPFWVPATDGVRFSARPGVAPTVEFPVVLTGEIDGTALLTRDGLTVEASNVEVELLDRHGEIVSTQKTAFDGFYLFEFVKPGDYVVRVSPEQLQRLGLAADPATAEVFIAADGTVKSGLDFRLQETGGDRTAGPEGDEDVPAPEAAPTTPVEAVDLVPPDAAGGAPDVSADEPGLEASGDAALGASELAATVDSDADADPLSAATAEPESDDSAPVPTTPTTGPAEVIDLAIPVTGQSAPEASPEESAARAPAEAEAGVRKPAAAAEHSEARDEEAEGEESSGMLDELVQALLSMRSDRPSDQTNGRGNSR